MKKYIATSVLLGLLFSTGAFGAEVLISHEDFSGAVRLAASGGMADIYVDANDAKLSNIAAGLLAGDIERVTGKKPRVINDAAQLSGQAVIVGSIGHSQLIDRLISEGKIDAADVRGQWETFKLLVVERPMPNVERALVIFGSDRRGAAFGVFTLSEAIGVSPWYWWADVTPFHQDSLYVKSIAKKIGPPSVKYRGIFINDEDWGLQPWSAKNFETNVGDIGPKTYAKVFELLLRLKANYIWPAMHEVTKEFDRIPGNVELADEWGIVAGASHPEPMNRNNVHWNNENRGPWRYDTNREAIKAYWEEAAKSRGKYEANWTIGMRGVHDSGMQGPSDMPSKVKLLEEAIADQRELLKKYVDPDILKVPQIFTPYKEALQMYQAGLKVPDDVTIVWTEDNYGYIRQLSNPTEQKRSGGSGVYYHISYLGSPFSYVWINTTPPALIWEEMSKAYAYGADRVWVLNVGDIKPGEVGIDFWMELGWDINSYTRETLPQFLVDWAKDNFGEQLAPKLAAVMDKYYRLGFARKPESLHRTPDAFSIWNYNEAERRLADYANLVAAAEEIGKSVDAHRRDAFFELVLYPVRMAALSNEVFICNSFHREFTKSKTGKSVYSERALAAYNLIDKETKYYNDELVGGKWKGLMTAKGTSSDRWGFQWPLTSGDNMFEIKDAMLKAEPLTAPAVPRLPAARANPSFVETIGYLSMEAEHFTRNIARNGAQWQVIPGLGRSGDSISVYPVTTPSIDDPAKLVSDAPLLEYDITTAPNANVEVIAYCLPTRRINDARGLRYAIAIDDAPPQMVDFNQAGEGREWSDNIVRDAAITTTKHKIATMGKHTLKIWMVDPGVVLDKIVINLGGLKESYLGPPETLAN